MKIPYINTGIAFDIASTLFLAPIWWVLGVSIFIYHIVSVFLVFKLILVFSLGSRGLRAPTGLIPLLCLIIFYFISILLNMPFNDTIRTAASLYNWSFWIMGLFIILVIYNIFAIEDVRLLTKAMMVNCLIIGILAICALLFWKTGHHVAIEYPTPLFLLIGGLNKIAHLQASATINIMSLDWFSLSKYPRLSIMAPYYTALGGMMLIMLPFLLTGRKTLVNILSMTGGAIALLFSLSRLSIFALAIGFLFVRVLNYKHWFLLILLLVLIVIFSMPVLVNIFNAANELRVGSSSLRFDLYSHTFVEVMDKNIWLGMGAKPRENFLSIPVGSHSTYISVLYRVGIMGLLAFIAFQISCIFAWLRIRINLIGRDQHRLWSILGVALIAMSIWMIGEDIDAPQLVAFLYFILVGIIFAFGKYARNQAKDLS